MFEALFLQVLNMSFTVSMVILFVLLARLPLRKAPKLFSYMLWSVVLFRLICPFSLESAISFLPTKTNPIPSDIMYTQTPIINTEASLINNSANAVFPAPGVGVSINSMKTMVLISTIVWLTGIAVMLVYSVVSLVKLRSKLDNAIHEKENIYTSPNIASPFVMGLIHPKIYLPASLIESERAYIILHEQVHIKRFDHIVKIISFFVLCIHWFNPLVWIAFFFSGRDMELSCDESVIKMLGSQVKKDYSSSLLTLATGRRIVGGTPLAFGEGDTEKRIKNVLKYKKPAFWVITISTIAVATIVIGLITNPKDASILIPKREEVSSIRIEQVKASESLGIIEIVDESQIDIILKNLRNTNQTARESVTDSPNQEDYFQIDISGFNTRRFFLYNDGNQSYVEEPYVGIYSTDFGTNASIAAIYTSSGNGISTVYSIAKVDKNGNVFADDTIQNHELSKAILMDALVKSAVWEGEDITMPEECYLIRQTFPEEGEIHDYYAYRLEEATSGLPAGTAVLQYGVDGRYSMISDDLYEALSKQVTYSPSY